MLSSVLLSLALLWRGASAQTPATSYSIDDTAGPSRTFDGIGGLSGGGATSVFLPSYQEPVKSQILDLLFKPQYGASLHILKVEIGGDAQSTDGSESSHAHDPWTMDFTRGYEWMLIQEAKARSSAIKTYGLPWAFPAWVGCAPGTLVNCSGDPYSQPEITAGYITSWVMGLRDEYSTQLDYVGSWNERGFSIPYLLALRSALNDAGFAETKIIAADSSFNAIVPDILSNASLAAAVWGLGAHYPNMQSGTAAEETGKQLWASEEDSTFNNAVGAGCWARVINQNFVRGNMTASINWNVIASYMAGVQWWRAGLMTAFQPWSGSFGSFAMIWATAHTTQFSQPGWAYLANGTGAGTGSGLLAAGGSYVTLQNFSSGDFSIVIEKMSRDHSPCCRPNLAPFFAGPETATFQLVGGPAKAASLQLWRTHWSFGAPGDVTSEFELMAPVPVVDGRFTLLLEVDSLYTLTTLTTGNKGSFPAPPPPAPFPPVHVDDFDTCRQSSEPPFWSDQNGAFECVHSTADRGMVMEQKVPLKPIAWGGDIRPHSLLGSRNLADVSLSIDVQLTDVNGSALLGARMAGTTDSRGAVWAVDSTGAWNVTGGMSNVQTGPAYASGTLAAGFAAGAWHTVRLDVNGSLLSLWVDGAPAIAGLNVSWAGLTGHTLIGTVQYAHFTRFDRVALYSTQRVCSAAAPPAGAPLAAVMCAVEVGPRAGGQLTFTPTLAAACPYGSPCAGANGSFALASAPGLCLAAAGAAADNAWPIVLAPCAAGDPAQLWTQSYSSLYSTSIIHSATGRELCTQTQDIGAPAFAAKSTKGLFQGAFSFVGDEGEIVSINAGSICIGTC